MAPDDIRVITVRNPPVNSVNSSVAQFLANAIDEATIDPVTRAVVITGAGSTFIAGADIKMLSEVVEGKAPLPDLLTFLKTIEQCPKPVVMAIHGTALGGGLETAMAGHYRVATPSAKLGQPEVKLGLIPGMGGTQRLPRLVGAGDALALCITGEPITAQQALDKGLIDQIIEGDLLAGAIAFARSVAGTPARITSQRACTADSSLFAQWRAQAHKQKRGQTAPLLVIDAIEAATHSPFEEGLAKEQELFRTALASEQAAAMIHVFFAERAAAKVPGLTADITPRAIDRAAVAGAGFMGTGIAMSLASAGIPVLLQDVSVDALDRAIEFIQSKRPETLKYIHPQVAFDRFDTVDLVIEAVFEDLATKQAVFQYLAEITPETTILATNTSTLDVDAIASVTGRANNCLGLHFFSPAHVMRLLEVVRGRETSDEVIATAMALGKRLGKVAVLSRNAFGFIGNRMVMPYLREAHRLLEEGASIEQINRALYDFGMAMGPLAMEDLVGLDVTHAMRQEAQRRQQWPDTQSPLADRLYEQKRYGQKTKAGWSRYDEARRASPDPELKELLSSAGRVITSEEIQTRCLKALIQEGQRVLDEGVALRPEDVDTVFIHGYGFPAWRGGPMYQASRLNR